MIKNQNLLICCFAAIAGALISSVAQGASLEAVIPARSGEEIDRAKLRVEVLRLLDAKDYDKLDARAQELQKYGTNYPSGYPQLTSFYLGLTEIIRPSSEDADYEERLEKLKAWAQARPQSSFAAACYARGWFEFAFFGRGDAQAAAVTKTQLKHFTDRLAEAKKVLDASATASNKLPVWYATALRVVMAQEVPRGDYEALYQQAIKAFPAYEDFHFHKAYYLAPAWFGKSGEAEKFINDVTASRQGDEISIGYARLVWQLRSDECYGNIFQETSISWQRAKAGFTELLYRYPHAIDVANEFCYEALQAGDRATARRIMKDEIKGHADLEVWKSRARFVKFQEKLLSE